MSSPSHHSPVQEPARLHGQDEHAFVIKLYARGDHHLYGHITHVMSRRREAVRRPEDVVVFLAPYLAAMGVRLRPRSRLLVWLSRFSADRPPPPLPASSSPERPASP